MKSNDSGAKRAEIRAKLAKFYERYEDKETGELLWDKLMEESVPVAREEMERVVRIAHEKYLKEQEELKRQQNGGEDRKAS